MTTKKIPAKKAAAKKAAKVAKKTPTKTATKKYVPPGKLVKKAAKVAAKKVATKKATPAKKAAPAKKSATASKVPTAGKKPSKVMASVSKPAPVAITKAKAPRSDKPIDATRPTLNGVLRPHAKSVAGGLWKIADDLREKLKRAPARFEFRAKVTAENEKIVANGGTPYADNSVSFQYFKWRTFNGIKGREVGLYPKRNSFELSVPVVRTPRAPKAAPASIAKKVVAKKAAKAAKVEAPAPASVPAAPAVSSRLASISEAAATGDA